jgi:hypothetical protein
MDGDQADSLMNTGFKISDLAMQEITIVCEIKDRNEKEGSGFGFKFIKN